MKTKYKIIVGLFLIGLIILARLIPHFPNVAPVVAVALVAAAYLGRRWAIVLPFLGMLLSDIFIGFYHWPIMLSVYGSFMLIGFIGSILVKYWSLPVVVYSTGASLFFYIITNFAVWLGSAWYPKTFVGLLYAYEMGLPFLRYALVGDFIYTVVLSSVFALAYNTLTKPSKYSLSRKNNYFFI